MRFNDKVVIFSDEHVNDVDSRVLSKEEMEIMQLLFMDIESPAFSCDEDQFANSVFTPHYLEMLRENHLKRFKIKKV